MRRRLAAVLVFALLLAPGIALAGGTSLQDCLGRAIEGWAREVKAGRGSSGALEECAAGRFPEAFERARKDGDALGASLLEVPVLLGQETGAGPGLVRACGVLEGRVEPLLIAWLRFHAGLDFAIAGRVTEASAQLEASVALFRQGGSPVDLGEALKQLAGVQLQSGRAAQAAGTYAEAAGLARSQGRAEEEAVLVGMRARALAELGRLAEAVRLYRESLPILERAGQDQRAFSGRSDLGTVLMRQGRYAEAEVEIDASLHYFESVGPPALALGDRINRAALDLERGRPAQAEALLRACLEGALEPDQDAAVRLNLAQALLAQGRYPEAERMLVALAESNTARGAELSAAAAWNSLGSVYRQQKRLAEAEVAWKRVLETHRRLGNPSGEAGALTNLGNLRLNQGEPVEAEGLLRQALALYESMGAEAAAAVVLQDLSGPLMARGRYEAALESVEQARATFERLGHRTGWAAASFKTAILRLWLGQRREALDLLDRVEAVDREEGMERALVDIEHVRAALEADTDPAAAEARLAGVAERLAALGTPREVAGVRAEQAGLALSRGDTRKASALAKEALAGWQEQDLPLERLGAQMTLAGAAAVEGRLDEASRLFDAVWQESRRRGLPLGEAVAAGSRARVDMIAGRMAEAEKAAEAAEAAGASLQKDLFYAGGEAAATSQAYPFYCTVARIQVALGHPERAFEALERGRGRLLEVARLRTLAAAKTPEARALLARLRAAQAAVLLARDRLAGAKPGERASLEAEADRQVRERDRLEVELSRLTRTWDQLRDPTAAAVREALPARTALLEYAFLDAGLEVYLVTREGVSRFVLLPTPAAATVADEVLEARLQARTRECMQAVGADRLVAQILQGAPEGTQTEARRLWDLLLAPLEGRLAGVDRLLVVPDRDLHFLPFEALQDPQGRWLLERYSVTYLNTARELFLPPSPAAGPPLVVGGPAYSLAGQAVAAGEEIRRLGGPWADLAGARQEAGSVASLEGVPPVVGEAATEAAVKKSASGSSALHLATHGFVGAVPVRTGDALLASRRPQDVLRDCGLVLAGANGGGDGREDGILTALEVLGLDLGGTRLVVLSACDTGRGEVNASEGVFGLKRSFLAAGARQVVFSMWPVSDAGTRALMTRFYQHLKEGRAPSDALRAARLELLRGDPVLLAEGLAEEPEQFQSPFFWAPFAIVGRPDS